MNFIKNASLSILLLGTIAALFVASCKPKKVDTSSSGQSLTQLFSGLSPAPQLFTINAGRDTAVYGAAGTLLHFYPKSFKTASRGIISSGTIIVQLVEMYKPGDMIAARTSTVTDGGKLLQSAGQVAISATMDGQTVYANKYGIGFAQNNATSQKMELFYSNTTNAALVANWSVSDTTQAGTTCDGTDSAGNQIFYAGGIYMPPPKPWYYIFDSCTSFHFINCDYWWNYSGALNPVHLTLSDGSFNKDNTQAFLALTDDQVNISFLIGSSASDIALEEGGVPPGRNYKVVVISNKDGNYYYFQQSGVTAEGLTINAVLTPSTQAAIKSELQSF